MFYPNYIFFRGFGLDFLKTEAQKKENDTDLYKKKEISLKSSLWITSDDVTTKKYLILSTK